MARFDELLHQGRPLASDGAFGTQLMARGMQPGEVPELWNVDRAEDVEAIHRAYVDAGADLVETNTFGGNALTLGRHGMADRMAELNRAGVTAARRATQGTEVLVAGSMGPTGLLLAPLGEATPEGMAKAFGDQARVLAEAGADLLVVETMTCLDEAVIAVEAARTTGLPVVATMTYNKTKRGFFTVMGDDVAATVARLSAAGACAVGSNCGNGTDVMVEVARAFAAATKLPLFFQSNAGLPKLVDGKSVYTEGPGHLAAFARSLLDMGVAVVGGCCGTGPEHVAAVAAVVRERRGG